MFIPLMPEGVEHPTTRLEDCKEEKKVFIPLMPEGVEHVEGHPFAIRR